MHVKAAVTQGETAAKQQSKKITTKEAGSSAGDHSCITFALMSDSDFAQSDMFKNIYFQAADVKS